MLLRTSAAPARPLLASAADAVHRRGPAPKEREGPACSGRGRSGQRAQGVRERREDAVCSERGGRAA